MQTNTQDRATERQSLSRRVVFAEEPAVARALERLAVEHGRSLAAEVRGLVRRYLSDEEGAR
jgi:plasmid stability protein